MYKNRFFRYGLIAVIVLVALFAFFEAGQYYVSSSGEPAYNEPLPEHQVIAFHFRNEKLLNEHYEKHGAEMGFASAADYEAAASAVITNPSALYKIEREDGDGVYYVEATNEFVVLSTDGYIRTYFCPDSGKKYFDKQ